MCARRRSSSITRSSKATKTRSPPLTQARCRKTSTTPRPATTRAPAKVRSSTTTSPSRCTTTSSPPSAASCRRSTSISKSAARRCELRDLHHYDTYVPILSELDAKHSWKQAVDVVVKSLEPLGDEYCRVLHDGLAGRWCDRYPNQGKRSGAFSSGSYKGWPYILMNYQPDVLDHVFTLAHEAGHSMHTHYSAKNQPYQYYNYTIFVAEVASTFNEQLLSRHLMQKAKGDEGPRVPHQPRDRLHPRHDHPPNDVRRVREDLARPRRGGRAPHRRKAQGRIRQAAGRLLRSRLRDRRAAQARMPPHSRTSTTRSTSTNTPPASPPRSPSASA